MICIATVSFRLPKKARELAMAQDKRHVGWLIKQTNDELEHKINNKMRPMDVTIQQMHALITLASTPEGMLSFKQLKGSLGVAQSTIWGLVSRLEGKALIECLENPRTHVARSSLQPWLALTKPSAKLHYLALSKLEANRNGYSCSQQHHKPCHRFPEWHVPYAKEGVRAIPQTQVVAGIRNGCVRQRGD